MTLTLLSVGQLMMMVELLVVITLAAAQGSGGHAPIIGLYLVTLVGFIASVACTFASLALGRRVRYSEQERADQVERGEPQPGP
jgi:membrane protein implicated in regulation of membrane protease activity